MIRKFFSDLRLTLTQWTVATLALIVGGLVVALKLQGRKLHRTKLELLETQIDHKTKDSEEAKTRAVERYEEEKSKFVDAGGRLE